MRTMFTAEIRVLLCEACGAPLEAPVGGAQLTCTYCRAQNVVVTRDERPTLGMPAAPMPISEDERLHRLRAQDGRPLLPPQSIAYLVSGSGIEPSKVQEAFLVYQATRKEVRATSSPDAAERLYFLTLLLSNHLSSVGDDARRRAILETTLDALYLPRHKQVMRCQLATAAAREGDLVAAERWIGPCDERSDDLESDSAWRVCRAYIDTVKRDYGRVISVLSAVDDAVPIADSRDPVASVLRANALERMGDVDAAVRVLRSRMQNEAAPGRAAIEMFVKLNEHLQLCAVSLPQARQGHAVQAANTAASSVGGGIGPIFTVVGVLAFGLGVVLALSGVVPALLFTVRNGGAIDPTTVLSSLGGGVMMGLGPLIVGVVFTLIGGGLWRSARRAKWLRLNGVSARAVVRNLEGTGTRINNVPMMRVHLEVRPPNGAPYAATFNQLMTAQLMMVVRPGAEVPVRYDPAKPTDVLLELS